MNKGFKSLRHITGILVLQLSEHPLIINFRRGKHMTSSLTWLPGWSPKCNNCPKFNKVLNVISLQCNSLTPSAHCCYGGHPLWDVKVTAVALKKPLTSIHVTLRARWYQSASFYLLDIRNISSRSMVLKAVYRSSWRKSFPAQSGLVLGWKLNRMESISA